MDKSRFGEFYLFKIWGLSTIIASFVTIIVDLYLFFINANDEFFNLVFAQIISSLLFTVPALIITEGFYRDNTESNFQNKDLFTKLLSLFLISHLLIFIIYIIFTFLSLQSESFLSYGILSSVSINSLLHSNSLTFPLSFSIGIIFSFFYLRENNT